MRIGIQQLTRLVSSNNKDIKTLSTPAPAKSKKNGNEAVSNPPNGTQKFTSGIFKTQLKRDREQAASVVKELLDSRLADEFVGRFTDLCKQTKDSVPTAAAAERAKTRVANEYGLPPEITGFVLNALQDPATRESAQADVVVKELKASRLLKGFMKRHAELVRTTGNLASVSASYESATTKLAKEYGLEPTVVDRVLLKLSVQNKDGSIPPSNSSAKKTRRAAFSLPDNNNTVQSSQSSSAGQMSADQKDILRQIYEGMRLQHANDPLVAKVASHDRFNEIFSDVAASEIDRQLNELNEGMQFAPLQVRTGSSSMQNINDGANSANRSPGALSAHKFDELRGIYRSLRRQHDPTMARLHAKLQFALTLQLPASAATVAAINQQLDQLVREAKISDSRLIDSNRDRRHVGQVATNSKTDGSPSAAEKTQILNEIYSAICTNQSIGVEAASRLAAMEFKKMFPLDSAGLSAIVRYLQHKNQSTPSRVNHGPSQGEVVVTDLAKVYCGQASPRPVNPGQSFYREKQIPGACAQHSLNALVGFDAFDMQYIENVKRDVLAKTLGMSLAQVKAMEDAESGDAGHDPEILAECLRRKAQAGEIDPKWRNAMANVSVEVNDALWSQLEQRKLDGLIIGRSDNSHYVSQRTDSSGQDRILNSLKTEEINMTTRQYIETLLNEMPATKGGKKTLHFITCRPAA